MSKKLLAIMLSYAMITYSFTSTVGGPVVHNKSALTCILSSFVWMDLQSSPRTL